MPVALPRAPVCRAMIPPFQPGDLVQVASRDDALIVVSVVPSDYGKGWQVSAVSRDGGYYTKGPIEHFRSAEEGKHERI